MKKIGLIISLALTVCHATLHGQAITVTCDNNVRIGTGTPTRKFEVMEDAYFACQPANSGFYFEDLNSTNPIILPQFGNSMYIGKYDWELWDITSHYFHYDYLYQQSSDISVKENIREIENPLEKILNIRGITFDYKSSYFTNNAPQEKLDFLEDERKDNIGFIAQELKEVFPKLVIYNEESEIYNVNYIGLIPILVEAIKEQQRIIENLQIQFDTSSLKSGSEITGLSEAQNENIILFQNFPNPSSDDTKIEYYLPDNVQQAIIYIYDLNGKQLKSIPLVQKGKGSIVLNANELKAGMYKYTLITNERVIDTKTMILTD